MLHWGTILLKQLYNLDLKFKENWPKINCSSEFKPVVCRRYVEDVFVLFKSKDLLLSFARYINTRHKNFKFTFDFEQNNSLSFLDVKITRGSKATFNGVFTNFDSFIFESYKTGFIFTLLFRWFKNLLRYSKFHLEINQLRQIFKCNNYPVTLMC